MPRARSLCVFKGAGGRTKAAVGCLDSNVWVWDLEGRVLEGILCGHLKPVTCLAARLGMLYSGSVDGTVRGWETDTLECEQVLEGFDATAVYSLAVLSRSSDNAPGGGGPDLLLAGSKGEVVAWSVPEGEEVRRLMHTAMVEEVDSSSGDEQGLPGIGAIVCGTREEGPSANGDLDEEASIYTGADDGVVRQWSPASWACKWTFSL